MGISTFLGFLESGGEFKWCNSHVTAYTSVLKFYRYVSKASHILKSWLLCTWQFYFLSTAIQLIVSIQSAWTQIQMIQYDQLESGKYCLLCLQGHFLLKQCDVAIMDSFIVVNGLNIINYICFTVNQSFSAIKNFELFTYILLM